MNKELTESKCGCALRSFLMLPNNVIPIGTKSLLFGVHQVLIHPYYVLKAHIILYGWPRDFRVYLAIFVHDLGYWGRHNMDGFEGKAHVWFGAKLMYRLFDDPWFEYCAFHSRSVARKHGKALSALAFSDKLSLVLMPRWLYILLATATGEYKEYMHVKEATVAERFAWLHRVQLFTGHWCFLHLKQQADNWPLEAEE